MCGIFGAVRTNGFLPEELIREAHEIQRHRGPDAEGTWVGRVGVHAVTLGHQRLSILDLSDAGNQPMISRDQSSVLIYNGEVYNYLELRAELRSEGETFTTGTDTEVVQAALRRWGPVRALERFNGMWAFAWLDRTEQRLVLARDRAGEKPLYLTWVAGSLYFASEIKTLLRLTKAKYPLNPQVVGEYLVQGLLEASDQTFLQGIEKLPAASLAEVDLRGDPLRVEPRQFWRGTTEGTFIGSPAAFAEELRELFIDAVRIRLRSDVPVGILLSGGVDSSSIAAAAHHVSAPDVPLNLLGAVSDDPRFDESPHIDRVARHLGRPVHKVKLDLGPHNVFEYLERVSWYHDGPVADLSTVAHFLLMERAKSLGITVILSGQGADELLCGYLKYLGFYVQWLTGRRQFAKAASVVWRFWRNRTMLSQFTFSEAKRYLPSWLRRREADTRGDALRDFAPVAVGLAGGSVEDRQLMDVTRFSVPILTHYEDRMSMAFSREIRLPFLDVRIMDRLLAAPVEYKLNNGWSKYIFRKAMEDIVPHDAIWRRDKRGFVNPQGEWLKHELRQAVLDYFAPDCLIFQHRLVKREALLAKYDSYCRQPLGRGVVSFRDIFSPLSLEVWLRRFAEFIQ